MAKAKPDPDQGATDSESPSFEGSLEQLETTVARLEEGELPLEEALELFEVGVKLTRQCEQTLDAAERRIEILVADRSSQDGNWEAEEFEEDPEYETSDLEDEDED